MKIPYVILRRAAGAARDVFQPGILDRVVRYGGRGAVAAAAAEAEAVVADQLRGFRIDMDELSHGDVATLRNDVHVVGLAPSMPMKLIEPREEPAAGGAVGPGDEWGIQAVGARTSPFDGSGIVAAVLDTGIDKNHAAFAGVTLVEKDFTGSGNGDTHGHGTHCAGTIFGRDVGGRRIGVARGISKALIGKVLGAGGGSSGQIVQAIMWAANEGANVISMSLGIDFPGAVKQWEASMPTEPAVSSALEAYRANVLLFASVASLLRAQALMGQVTIIVAAAGNESRQDLSPGYKIAVSPPAVSEGIISVAALGQTAAGLAVAPFSNTGANVSAPGVSINSAKVGGGLRLLSGTSMATPHVAGVVALWAQQLKSMNNLTESVLVGRLGGSGHYNGFVAGYDPADVGLGLVRAPQ